LQLIAAHPFGVGTGDISDVLVENYRREGLYDLADTELNPHNSFLQIALAQGIPALLVFLFSLAYSSWVTVQRKDWLYAFFLISIVLNFMVESMLEKQSGVIFFAFFNVFLFFSRPSETHNHLP
jgi:O-antigen ligase